MYFVRMMMITMMTIMKMTDFKSDNPSICLVKSGEDIVGVGADVC